MPYAGAKPRRVIPPKNRKKERQNMPPDKRPHIGRKFVEITRTVTGMNGEWIGTKKIYQSEEIDPRYFLLSNRSFEDWNKQEIHTLIDQHHEILDFDRTTRDKLHRMASFILRKFRKQKFRCAITGIPFKGGIGFGNFGIGIDFKNNKCGISKSNIRLVSAPLAIARHYGDREPDIETPHQSLYEGYEIAFAIAKFLHWELKRSPLLKHIPMRIRFKSPIRQKQYRNQVFIDRPNDNLIVCEWRSPFLTHPWDIDTYKALENREDMRWRTTFSVGMDGSDIIMNRCYIGVDYCDSARRYQRKTGQTPLTTKWSEIAFTIADPNIDIIDEIITNLSDSHRNFLEVAALRPWF